MLAAAQKRHGKDAVHSRAVDVDAAVFAVDDGCVAYVDDGDAWVAVGAPLASDPVGAAVAFVAAAAARGRRAVFFGVEGGVLDDVCATVVVGAVPEWRTATWAAKVAATRGVRAQLRRGEKKGVRVRALPVAAVEANGAISADAVSGDAVDAPVVVDVDAVSADAVDALVDVWQARHALPPFAFVARPAPRAPGRHVFVAERAGALVAVLSASHLPAARRFVVDDLIRHPRAPQGTSELLIHAAITAAGALDVDVVTLGVTPLVGARGALAVVRTLARPLYDFDGLARFRRRLHPDAWVPVAVASSKNTSPTLAIVPALRAFAGGSFVAFALRALRRFFARAQ